eukprot:5731034-Prymnesium_polylepis.2
MMGLFISERPHSSARPQLPSQLESANRAVSPTLVQSCTVLGTWLKRQASAAIARRLPGRRMRMMAAQIYGTPCCPRHLTRAPIPKPAPSPCRPPT